MAISTLPRAPALAANAAYKSLSGGYPRVRRVSPPGLAGQRRSLSGCCQGVPDFAGLRPGAAGCSLGNGCLEPSSLEVSGAPMVRSEILRIARSTSPRSTGAPRCIGTHPPLQAGVRREGPVQGGAAPPPENYSLLASNARQTTAIRARIMYPSGVYVAGVYIRLGSRSARSKSGCGLERR